MALNPLYGKNVGGESLPTPPALCPNGEVEARYFDLLLAFAGTWVSVFKFALSTRLYQLATVFADNA